MKADLILLIDFASSQSHVGDVERAIMADGSEVRKKLILLHSEGRKCPAGIAQKWLDVSTPRARINFTSNTSESHDRG
jgi:hypothetical protein